ncbi:hypothetical protein CC99x_006130 [Candidatus Berkiella cookevillensis]|uniref:Uncharacterized protein n=1 Tax=Candidatus Berkiella cookevillensis TaxID=437022 RepID=A0A0Q9YUZ3_9GAMM|nr:hypothetical protein [Candidatus Berkiella cookevillensis]MCS5708483.1 hypothetical protein [Candidatus Berkiella cookevillensis]
MANSGPMIQLQLLMLADLARPEPRRTLQDEESARKKDLNFLYSETKHRQKVERNQEKKHRGNKPVHYGKSSTPIQKRKGKF